MQNFKLEVDEIVERYINAEPNKIRLIFITLQRLVVCSVL